MLSQEKKFFSDLDLFAQEIKKRNEIVVIHHYDADGITSGAIIIKALERENKKVKSLCLKQLYKENIDEVKKLGNVFLFVDFGSGQLDILTKNLPVENIFVLDHHQPTKLDESYKHFSDDSITLNNSYKKIFHINPLLYNIDGGKELSGSGLAFFFAMALNKNNVDLAGLAIVGAVGDMQDFSGALIGFNRKIIDLGINHNIITVKNDLRLYGRISRPLTAFLMFSSNPILPGLTANEQNCVDFFKQNNIPLQDSFGEWLSYEDLSEINKKKLSSALIVYLSEQSVPEWKIRELIGEVYTLVNEQPRSPLRDAKEFATACNSAGRHAKPEIALNVCLGNRNPNSYYGQLLLLIDEHKRELRKGIEFVQNNGIEEKQSYYFFDAKNNIQDSLIGIIAGMLYGSFIEDNKPIIAIAQNNDDSIKVSGRGTTTLLRKGLNLGLAFKEIEKELSGVEGGGHKIAAGCKVPLNDLELFLDLLEKKLFEQLN